MKLIRRNRYLGILKECRGTPDIKVITGIRRCGKSKLLDLFSDEIRKTEPRSNIIKINFNLAEFEEINEYHRLLEYVSKKYKPDTKNYLMMDEIQLCQGFEKAINSLHAEEKYDIYITGPNAFLSSSDLATLFVGRTFEIPVFPFSFGEFLECFPVQKSVYDSFDDYLRIGGMPGSYVYQREERRRDYLNRDVLNVLIIRDIVQKQHIRNIPLLEMLLDFLVSNIGSLLSVRNIEARLLQNGTKANKKTIQSYIDYLTNAFAFYRMRRFDVKGRKYLQTDDKFYLVDISFRYSLLGTKTLDYGYVLENVIAIELLRRGYEVYAGKLYRKEIDFVALKENKRTYFQVAYSISDETTLKRELEPLKAIKDNYSKILIARTYQPEYEIDGIQIIDPSRWLLRDE